VPFLDPPTSTEVLLFYTFVQPAGTGATTTDLLGTVASIEPGGNLEGVTFNGTNTITLVARYSHYYRVQYVVDANTVATCSVTLSSNVTVDESSTAAASGTSNIVERTFHLTSQVQGNTQSVTLTLAAATITTPSFCACTIFDYGSGFNPANPIAGPSGEVSSSRWSRRRKESNIVQTVKQNQRMDDLEKQLSFFRKQLEMVQYESNFGSGSSKPQLTPIPEEENEDDYVEHLDDQTGKFVNTRLSNLRKYPDSTPSENNLDCCRICGMRNPDHLGRNCPKQLFPLPDSNNRRTKN